jgi:hypothetical protein
MGLFSDPKCPNCNWPLTRTYYAFPFPQWRCKNCIKRNEEKKATEDRIKALENIILKKQTETKDHE